MDEASYWAKREELDTLEEAAAAIIRKAGGDEFDVAEACDKIFGKMRSKLNAEWCASHPSTIDEEQLMADVEESLKHFNDDLRGRF